MAGNNTADNTFRHVEEFLKAAVGQNRLRVIDLAHRLIQSLETPADILQRIGYTHLQTTATHLAIDLKIFESLAQADGPLTDTQLAAPCHADPVLIARITRCLAAYNMIDVVETRGGSYVPNKVTRTFAQEEFKGGFMHQILSVIPSLNALPAFLSSTGYQNPSDESNTAFNMAFNTPLLFFPYIKDRPEYMAAAGQYMGVWRDSQTSWLNVYPFEDEVKRMMPTTAATAEEDNVSSSVEEDQRILFVDVGGALGQQCRAVRKKFPHLKGRVINQDLAAMLDARTTTAGDDDVEFMVHDFFQPQDKLGQAPLFFYLRNVLHDWPDHLCIKILTNLRDALLLANPKSAHGPKILIDEVAVPEVGASRYVVNLDMVMMSVVAAQERTLEQWKSLVAAVGGLKISRTFAYEKQLSMEVLELELA